MKVIEESMEVEDRSKIARVPKAEVVSRTYDYEAAREFEAWRTPEL